MKWSPFQFNGINWQYADIDQYEQHLTNTLTPLLQQQTADTDVLNGQMVYLKSFAVALLAGVPKTTAIPPSNDAELQRTFQSQEAAFSLIESYYPNNGMSQTGYFAYLGSLAQGNIPTSFATFTNAERATATQTTEYPTTAGIASAINSFQVAMKAKSITPEQQTVATSSWAKVAIKGVLGSNGLRSGIKELRQIQKLKATKSAADIAKAKTNLWISCSYRTVDWASYCPPVCPTVMVGPIDWD